MNSQNKAYICVEGGPVLKGTIQAFGAKNAVLPIVFSTLLSEGQYTIHNVPSLQDVFVAKEILESLGCEVNYESHSLKIKHASINDFEIPKNIAQKMRASFLCLGPLLAKYKQARVPLPGGCKIGERPVDFHLEALKALGADLKIHDDYVEAKALKGLKGCEIEFPFPTVGGTENILMASVMAQGITTIKNCATEPEIQDLIAVLKKMGAKINQEQERTLVIEGVDELKAFDSYSVISDRIEAGTLLLAGAITGGEVQVENCNPDHLKIFLEKLKFTGFDIQTTKNSVTLKSTDKKQAISIKTGVHPDFPTDLQSQFASLMTQLEGESTLEETIFENRFRYVESFKKFQADIHVKDKKLYIQGPTPLKAAEVQATDLRASAGLILAGLVAEGETRVTDIFHLDRGYESLDKKLATLGASIKRAEA